MLALTGAVEIVRHDMSSGQDPSNPGTRNKRNHGLEQFSDAHVHLFNGGDLPVVGFAKYVLLPEFLPGWEELASIFTNIALQIVKPLAPSIMDERRFLGMDAGRATKTEVSIDEAARKVADLINSHLTKIDTARNKIDLSDFQLALVEEDRSALVLADLLLAFQPDRNDEDQHKVLSATDRSVDPETVRRLMEGELVNVAYDASSSGRSVFALKMDKKVSFAQLQQMFVWIWRMLRYRSTHLKNYAKEMNDKAFRPEMIINLLVDYDEWLRLPWDNSTPDGPGVDSGHSQQIEFWKDFNQPQKNAITIHTFAGYDPLKHAKEMFLNSDRDFSQKPRSPYFESLIAFAEEGTARGFKIYPPMGFRTYDNKCLNGAENRDFVGANGIGSTVVDWWGKQMLLGPALDKVLDEFYTQAQDKSIPILIHTGATNLTSESFSDRPSQRHLIAATNVYPNLRLCIGHFTSAQPFIEAMEMISSPDDSLDDSPVEAIRYARLLFTARTPNVFADTGYMEEFLGKNDRLATNFFSALLRYFDLIPDAENRIMFGSDWIMLATEPNHKKYVRRIHAGLKAAIAARGDGKYASFPDKYFRDNFRRFLNLS